MPLSARLVRFEERFAVLQNEMLGEFRWPLVQFPSNVKIDDMVNLSIKTQKEADEEKYTGMRKLLEELIN